MNRDVPLKKYLRRFPDDRTAEKSAGTCAESPASPGYEQ